MIFPVISVFSPEIIPNYLDNFFYSISFFAVLFVMIIRPLADILKYPAIRALVILRKSFGILSASIVISFLLEKIIMMESISGYFLSPIYWS
jgi:hypothetical protein